MRLGEERHLGNGKTNFLLKEKGNRKKKKKGT